MVSCHDRSFSDLFGTCVLFSKPRILDISYLRNSPTTGKLGWLWAILVASKRRLDREGCARARFKLMETTRMRHTWSVIPEYHHEYKADPSARLVMRPATVDSAANMPP